MLNDADMLIFVVEASSELTVLTQLVQYLLFENADIANAHSSRDWFSSEIERQLHQSTQPFCSFLLVRVQKHALVDILFWSHIFS